MTEMNWNARVKDIVERVGSTAAAALLGLLVTDGFEWSSVQHWAFWAPVLTITAVTLLKSVVLTLAKPETGASFGTAVPVDGPVPPQG